MNCAVCGTPRIENEDSCLFCGAKFPELNSDQENENYMDNDVVSFGVEKDDDFDEDSLDIDLEEDIDLDALLQEIEDATGSLFGLDDEENENDDTENLEIEDFDFSIDDLSEIEKMLEEDSFAEEELDLDEDVVVQTEFSFLSETPLETEETFTKEDLDLIEEEIFEVEGFNLIDEEIFTEEEIDLIEEETLVSIEEESLEESLVSIEEESLEESLVSIEEESLEESLVSIEEDALEESLVSIEEEALEESLVSIEEDDLEESLVSIEEDDLEESLVLIEEDDLEESLISIEEDALEESLVSIEEEALEESLISIEEASLEEENVDLITEETFTEEELEFLNSRVEEVHGTIVAPTVENLIDESSSNSGKFKIEEEFDLSLEDLDNIEKGLNTSNDTVAILEEALLSGEDISSFDVKEAIANQNQIIEEIESSKKSFLEDETQTNAFENSVDENKEVEKEREISSLIFDKIGTALKAREKGESVDYILPSTDSRSDDEILRDVQILVSGLMAEETASNEDLSGELLELEQMLLAKDKEEAPRVIEDVEDVEGIDFVDVEDIDDEDNLVKPSADDEIQQGIDDLVKNFRENKDKPIEEQEAVQEDDIEPSAKNIELVEEIQINEENEEDLDELERIDREILKAKKIKEEAEERAANIEEIDSNLKELDSLILDVIGDLPDLETAAKAKKQMLEVAEAPVEVVPEPVMEKPLYDKELVKEYEALRLDLELFFPGTQELDRLNDDIDELLKEDDISELLEHMDASDHDVNFEGFDFEELTDKDISDALLDLRDSQDNIDRKRYEERKKKRKARRKKINSIITLGNRVKAYDTALLLVCITTAVVLSFAWISTVRTQNLTVNMLTRSEQEEVVDKLWNGLYDIATKFDSIQDSLEGYTKGEVDTNKVTFELNNLINDTIIARGQFEAIDLPTYSDYKYKIDEFLAKRMLLAEEVLADVTEGKTQSEAITEFLSIETDFATFEETKEKFNKQLNLSN